MPFTSRIKIPRHDGAKARRSSLAEAGERELMHELDIVERTSLWFWTNRLDDTVENVVGVFPMTLSVVPNFKVNGVERLVPFVTEERSVVAAAAKAAKLVAPTGFNARLLAPDRRAAGRGQVLLLTSGDSAETAEAARHVAGQAVEFIRRRYPAFVRRGGGLLEILPRTIEIDGAPALEVGYRVDSREAMGANGITAIGRELGAFLADRLKATLLAAICLNDCPDRIIEVAAVWKRGAGLTPADIQRVLALQAWAEASPERAVTHNKGVMNAVDAICLASGQDVRAVEAGAWADAYRDGPCRPLTCYRRSPKGDLVGKLRLQLSIGTVGGATTHPLAVWSRRLMKVETVAELASVIAAAGLAQNFAALLCLGGEGINEAHRRIAGHAKHP